MVARFLNLVKGHNLGRGEKIIAAVAVSAFEQDQCLTMLTPEGRIKRTPLPEFASIRQSGLNIGTKIGWAQLTRDYQDLIVVSQFGQAIRFEASSVRPTGRTAAGMNAIRLQGRDKVAGMDVVAPDADLLIVTTRAFAKRTPLSEYSSQRRGGSGMRTFTDNLKRTGEIIAAQVVKKKDNVIIISKSGVLLRTKVEKVSEQGRATRGKQIMNLKRGDDVVSTVAFAPTGVE